MSRGRKLFAFLAITFVASWSIGFTFIALGLEWEGPMAQAVGMLFMMPPAFAALIVKGPMAKEPVIEHLGLRLRPNRWWLIAWLIPPAVLALTLAVSALIPGVDVVFGVDAFLDFWRDRIPEEHFAEFEREVHDNAGMDPALRMLIQAMVAGVTINAIVALGEELGWRGFLHHELGPRFWPRALVTGAIWGAWHAPIVALGHNYPEHPAIGVFLMIAWAVAISPIFTYVRERSGSVVTAGILHGTLNALGGLPLMVTRGGSDLTVGFTGLAGFVGVLVVLGAIYAHDRWVAETPIMSRGAPETPS